MKTEAEQRNWISSASIPISFFVTKIEESLSLYTLISFHVNEQTLDI